MIVACLCACRVVALTCTVNCACAYTITLCSLLDVRVLGLTGILLGLGIEDFFFEELMPFVEQKYRIKGEKKYRAVAGLSMGGGGSFMYALHRPDLFSSACPLSAYIGPLTIEQLKQRVARRNMKLSESEIQEYFAQHNALNLINSMAVEDIKSVRWYIDCGDDDFLFEGNSLVHIAMKKKEIPHEYRVREGRHSWTYWRESLPKVLEFVSQAFHQY